MKNPTLTRVIAADFAASVLIALSIGVATSVALAGTVLFLAQQDESATVSVADRETP